MNAFVSALIYAWISHGLAFLLMPRSIPLSFRLRATLVWALTAPLLFFLWDWFLLLAVTGAAMIFLAPFDRVQRTAFFLVAAPCLPTYIVTTIPFPGINNLLSLNNYQVAVIVMLLPLFAMRRIGALRPGKLSIIDACLFFYIAYTAIVVALSMNVTVGLRHFMEQMLMLGIPFYVLRYAVQRFEDIQTAFVGYIVASIILASIALVSTAKQWDFYTLAQPASVFSMPDFRAGFVRIKTVADTHSLAYHLAAALIILEFLKSQLLLSERNAGQHRGHFHWLSLPFRWGQLMVLRFAFAAGLFFTNSYGAMLGLLVAWLCYMVMMIKDNTFRTFALTCALALSLVGGHWLLFGEVGDVDLHGNVGYRQQLFTIGSAYVLEHPIFGDYHFYRNSVFEPLRQGQGIIDITNLYLQIALHYGLLGAIPFFAVMAAPIIALFRMIYKLSGVSSSVQSSGRRKRQAGMDDNELRWRRMGAVLIAIQVGWLVVIGTMSSIGLAVHLGIVFAALGLGFADLGLAAVSAKQGAEDSQTSPGATKHKIPGLQTN